MKFTEQIVTARILDFVDGKVQQNESFKEDKKTFDLLLAQLKGTVDASTIFDLEAACTAMWVKAIDVSYRIGLEDGNLLSTGHLQQDHTLLPPQ